MPQMSTFRMLVAAALIAAAPAHAQKMADGNDWLKSSDLERRAYLVGVGNTLAAGYDCDTKSVPKQDPAFGRTAMREASGTTVLQAMERIDGWYQANPDKLKRPVLEVLRAEVFKPRYERKN